MSKAEAAASSSPLDRLLRPVGTTLGQLCFASLAVTAATGVVLGVLYDPGEPLASTEALQGAVAYGFLFRAVHNLGAQLFVVTLLLHTVDYVWARGYRALGPAGWWRLVAVAFLGVGAMFTGFVLRGDAEARAALAIGGSGVEVLPGIGTSLSRVLFGEPGGPLHAPYVHHVVTFTLLPWLLAIAHARRVWAGAVVTLVVLAAATAAGLLYHPGPGDPAGAAATTLWGPWYFIGVQESLRALPVWLVAATLAVVAVGGLGALGHVRAEPSPTGRRVEAAVRIGWLALGAAYLVVCLAAYLLRGGG